MSDTESETRTHKPDQFSELDQYGNPIVVEKTERKLQVYFQHIQI